MSEQEPPDELAERVTVVLVAQLENPARFINWNPIDRQLADEQEQHPLDDRSIQDK